MYSSISLPSDSIADGSASDTAGSGAKTGSSTESPLPCGHPPKTTSKSRHHHGPDNLTLANLHDRIQAAVQAYALVVQGVPVTERPRLVVEADSTSGSTHYTLVGGAFCSYMRHWCSDKVCYHTLEG